jgi:hypothetical protein
MKALVTINGKSIGMFYNMTKEETQAEMHVRILSVINYRYGNTVAINILWQNF